MAGIEDMTGHQLTFLDDNEIQIVSDLARWGWSLTQNVRTRGYILRLIAAPGQMWSRTDWLGIVGFWEGMRDYYAR